IATLLAGKFYQTNEYITHLKSILERTLEENSSLFQFRATIDGTSGIAINPETTDLNSSIVSEVRELLYQSTKNCRDLPDGDLKNHLFKWGNWYSLWWYGMEGVRVVKERLTDFYYLQDRLRSLANSSSQIRDLVKEYDELLERLPENEREEFFLWTTFFRERA